jgi:hypothetical protein
MEYWRIYRKGIWFHIYLQGEIQIKTSLGSAYRLTNQDIESTRDVGLRSAYPVRLSGPLIPSAYLVLLSGPLIQSAYPVRLSGPLIRSAYPVYLSGPLIKSSFLIRLSGPLIWSTYLAHVRLSRLLIWPAHPVRLTSWLAGLGFVEKLCSTAAGPSPLRAVTAPAT